MTTPSPTSNAHYWKQKISAYLHDSPNKVLDILGHEQSAQALAKVFEFETAEEFRKDADFAASAADRIPFPSYKKTKCASAYDIQKNPFKHPLSGANIDLSELQNTNLKAEEDAHKTIPILEQEQRDTETDRLSFLALWRFWQNWASDRSPQLGFYPAETRLPDHTIWSHLSITSAMQGCCGGSKADWDARARQTIKELPDKPALLLFSIGPVQDFIAAARTTRDLWSGSYLLSYLCATALKNISTDFGPDHVVFPNLKGQPLIDFMLRKDWKACGSSKDSNFWDAFDYSTKEGKDAVLTPSLPNRFLALVPEKMTQHAKWESAQAYAAHLAETIREELKAIADSVADKLSNAGSDVFLRDRFNQQVDNLLQIHWQVMPIDQTVDEIKCEAEILPNDSNYNPTAGLDAILEMVAAMPDDHRDKRYFKDSGKTQLNQATAAWPTLYAFTGWQLDGAKALRPFKANNSGTWKKGRTENKDSLTGKEEACLIAPEAESACEQLSKQIDTYAPAKSIKPNEFLGAATLIKRFWHLTWLCADREFKAEDFRMPNTHDIASHNMDSKKWDQTEGSESASKYYAILALDGDQMGKWVSGAKSPKMKDLLSTEAIDYFSQEGNDQSGFLDKSRPLSPSFHLQFSEMLGNFSLHCARRIVEHYAGRLIYAGGDDVLAMLPADAALDCAASLRAAFRGDSKLASDLSTLFQKSPAGCIQLTANTARKKYIDSYPSDADPLLSDPHRFPALVPGPATDVSCGIAIGHIKSPLQDMVKAAQLAEKRAKNELHRGACAISLFKRSGEIREWGFKWSAPGAATAPVMPLFKALIDHSQNGSLSSRFPYSLSTRLEPFVSRDNTQSETDPNFASQAGAIVKLELEHCLKQHQTKKDQNTQENILSSFDTYWHSLDSESEDGRQLGNAPEAKIQDFLGLLATLAWLNKH
jgi:CRISPR-associated protein Cmr2